MKTSKKGIQLIKSFEGCRLFAYKPSPNEPYYTIGYGHYGADVKENDTITIEKAEKLLINDLAYFEKNVNKWHKQYSFTQNQFDALVSFAYNVGSIDRLTQYGKRSLKEIASSFTLYCYSNGSRNQCLYERRKKEKELFLSENKKVTAESYQLSFRGKYRIIYNGLKLRESPNGKQIDAIKKDQTVTCYGYYTRGWLYVVFNGKVGFIRNNKKYIERI